jgi:putative hydrolase of the HAD superfamily
VAGSEDSDSQLVALVDVDGTLYPGGTRMEEVLERRLTEAVAHFLGVTLEEGRERQVGFRPLGSFRALVDRYGVAPEDYFAFVCNDETDPRKHLEPDPVLRAVLESVTARLFLFSNAPMVHCERVAEALGVRDLFDGVFEIAGAGWVGKPDPPLYERALAALGVAPAAITAVDDMPAALDAASRYGMRTVYIGGSGASAPTAHTTIASLHALESGAPWLFA